MTKCSKCGGKILDPFCEDACPNHLCSNCGEKCGEKRPDPVSKKCEECPYEVEPDFDDADWGEEEPNFDEDEWEEQEEQDEWYDPEWDDEEPIRGDEV